MGRCSNVNDCLAVFLTMSPVFFFFSCLRSFWYVGILLPVMVRLRSKDFRSRRHLGLRIVHWHNYVPKAPTYLGMDRYSYLTSPR